MTVVASTSMLVMAGASAALAFNSPGKPDGTPPFSDTITWTGQGANPLNQQCSGDLPADVAPGQPYLLWVLDTDHGTIQIDGATPTLNLGGTGQDTHYQVSSVEGSNVKFVTPYYDLSGLTANVSMTVTGLPEKGGGAWVLTISHGCTGNPVPPAAKALTISKAATGTYNTKYQWDIAKAVDKTRISTAPGGDATFDYTVTVTHDAGTKGDVGVSGEIHVNNPNGAPVAISSLTDQLSNGTEQSVSGPATLNSGDNTFPYSFSLSALPDGQLTNTATVTWDQQTLSDGSVLAADSATFTTADPIQFSQNQVDNGTVHVTDSLGGDLGTVSASGPSSVDFTYSHTFPTDYPGTCKSYDNTATITETGKTASQTVDVCVGADLRVTKTATPSFTRTYKWNISKTVDNSKLTVPEGASATANYTVNVTHDQGTDSDWQVEGKVTVTNPNKWESVTLTDLQDPNTDNGGTCIFEGTPAGTVIPADSSVDFPYTCTYSEAPDPAASSNTATATWDAATAYTASGSASGSAPVDFGSVQPNIVDGTIAVTDTLGGDLGKVSYTDPDNPKAFSYPVTFKGDPAGTCTEHGNTATFTTDTKGLTGSASQDVKVCVGANLTVAKTASPSFQRTYNWDIAKQADKTTIDPGGTVNYTVNVSQDPKNPFADSGWQVTGTITVTNPNDWEPVTVNVTDAINNGGTCTVGKSAGGDDPANAVIPASGSVDFPYTCTYGSAPSAANGTNTATATWDKVAASTPDGLASGNADFAFGDPTSTVNQTVHVTDSQGGSLGTAGPATDSAPWAPKQFTYSKTFSPPASGCAMVNNTATITETGQNASASVKNCNSGALTMGFWQNKNGQALIIGADQVKLGTFLKQYAPFQDFTSGTAANYITTIIKAANASGASMNAMLKAQMLATALDVYFSDPNLGGNKIGAPKPIGGLMINISSWGAAFGAAQLSVSDMLAYAASKSSVGGTIWYVQVKATQELAKNAFDAINNQVVSGP